MGTRSLIWFLYFSLFRLSLWLVRVDNKARDSFEQLSRLLKVLSSAKDSWCPLKRVGPVLQELVERSSDPLAPELESLSLLTDKFLKFSMLKWSMFVTFLLLLLGCCGVVKDLTTEQTISDLKLSRSLLFSEFLFQLSEFQFLPYLPACLLAWADAILSVCAFSTLQSSVLWVVFSLWYRQKIGLFSS